MLDRIGHKQRFRVLVGLLASSPLLLYWLAISDTVKAANECIELQQQYAQIGDLDMQLALLEKQVSSTDAALGMVEGEGRSFQTQLLTTVSSLCKTHALELVEFSEAEIYLEGDLEVETIPVTIQGGFKHTLEMLHVMETASKTGRLISVSHELVRLSQSRKKVLRTTFHVQNISKKL